MLGRLYWFWVCDRLGPDILLTHPFLFFKKSGRWICRKKFEKFGDNAEFRPFSYATCASRISIGDNVVIRPGSHFVADRGEGGRIIIEDDVLLGPGVHMYADSHKFEDKNIPIKDQGYNPSQDIRVCKGAWIGANAIILLGVTIGENAVVAAGSVVTKDVRPFTKVAGQPAREIT